MQLLPSARDKHCTYAIVEWRESLNTGDLNAVTLDDALPKVMAAGCVAQTDSAVVIIHTFTGSKPSNWIAIPKEWVDNIVILEKIGEPEEEKAPPVNNDKSKL
jgi:citrate lyase alpha subunit